MPSEKAKDNYLEKIKQSQVATNGYQPWIPQDDWIMVQLRRQGYSWEFIADYLGRSITACWLRANRLKKRGHW